MRALVAVMVLVGAAACGDASSDAPSVGGAAFELELMAADRAFDRAVQERGSAGWIDWFDAQGAMVQAGRGEIRGMDAIGQAIAGLDDPGFTLTWEPTRAQGADDGTLGYTVGRYTSTTVLGADTAVSRGVYVSIWRRQPDGTLRVVMDLGNPLDPAS